MAEEITQAVLGERLRTARLRVGLAQEDVAAKAGLPRTGVSDIERGVRRVDCLELKALATLYGEPLEHFLGDAPKSLSRTEQLVAQLSTMTTDLAGYIEQHARELAEPVIDLAERTAAHNVAVARGELDRERDLSAELRRQLLAAVRRAQRVEHLHQPTVRHRGEECPQCQPRTSERNSNA